MKANPCLGRRALRAALAVSLALPMAACMGDQQQSQGRHDVQVAATRLPQATFDCGEDGKITLQGSQSAVRLIEADGSAYDLPASPPTQASRFGEGGLALVVEGEEALWMKAGKQPMSCRR